MKKSNNLNCLTYGYLPLTYWKNWFGNIRQFFRNIKFAYQRITCGYCDQDTWNLDTYYSDLIYQTLSHLAKHTHGYPTDIANEFKWENILREMAEHFYNSVERDDIPIYVEADKLWKTANELVVDTVFEPTGNCTSKMVTITSDDEKYDQLITDWHQKYREASEFSAKEKDKAFEMMSKYFYNLWD